MSNGEFTIKNWATFKNALNKFIKELTYGVSAPRESAAKVNNNKDVPAKAKLWSRKLCESNSKRLTTWSSVFEHCWIGI